MSRPPSAGEALARPQQPLRVRERVGPRVVSLPFVVARSTALVKQCSVLERGLWESLRPALAVQRPVLPIPCRLMLRRRPQTTWPPQGQGFCQAGPSFWKPAFGSSLSYPPSDSLWQAPRPGHLPVSGPPSTGAQILPPADPRFITNTWWTGLLCQSVLVSGRFLEGGALHRIPEMRFPCRYSPFS